MPLALDNVASISHVVEGEGLVSVEVVRALLERVTQRIFQAALMLQAAVDDSRVAMEVQSAIDELDGALVDVRSTVFTKTAPLT